MATIEESISDVQFVDDLYFSSLFSEVEEEEAAVVIGATDQIPPISDAKYAENLQFQEALMASLISNPIINAAPKITVLANQASASESIKIVEELGESSHSFCEICADKKEADEMFIIESCDHSFCRDCVSKHVMIRVQESNFRAVNCPGVGCGAVLGLDTCRPLIRKDVVERWEEALCESMFVGAQKFYCPFRDCSAMLIDDNDGEVIRESECPICRRLFCAQCYVPWHPGIECGEFQRLNEDERGREDLMVRELARDKSWKRCPHCKYYVEKTAGCLHITCRCGFEFCYSCGATWSSTHGGCQ